MADVARAMAGILSGLALRHGLPQSPTAVFPSDRRWPWRPASRSLYPRREVKEYGTKKPIEGTFAAGETVVVLDDLITTGASKLEAIEPLLAAGLKVTDVVVLVDREQGGSGELAAKGLDAAFRHDRERPPGCAGPPRADPRFGALGCALCARDPLTFPARIAGISLPTPLVLASGIWGTSPALLERAARGGRGRRHGQDVHSPPRRGHKNPTAIDWGHGLINAMGLPNPGVEEELALLQEASRTPSAPWGRPHRKHFRGHGGRLRRVRGRPRAGQALT